MEMRWYLAKGTARKIFGLLLDDLDLFLEIMKELSDFLGGHIYNINEHFMHIETTIIHPH
jgi:hypothetical protein